MIEEGYRFANATAPTKKVGIAALKVVGFLVSVFFGIVGYAAFSDGAWILFVLGIALIAVLINLSKKSEKSFATEAAKSTAESMAGGLLVVGVIAVIAWAISGVGSKISGASNGSDAKVKTSDDCYRDHLSKIDAIKTFGSESGRQRQMAEAVKEWQACGEKALQNRMNK